MLALEKYNQGFREEEISYHVWGEMWDVGWKILYGLLYDNK